MIGYCVMDGLDFMRPDTLDLLLSSWIYVVLAGVFVIDSALQFFSIYCLGRQTEQYYTMIISSLFDKIGSHAYFLGALFTATAYASRSTIWMCNFIGVLGFVIGAAINMLVPGSTILYSWANTLNLIASLLYLAAIFMPLLFLSQILVLTGDGVYLIDAILYMITWFPDRQFALTAGK
jgi:hypothetical protein